MTSWEAGRGRSKKEAEQVAARAGLEEVRLGMPELPEVETTRRSLAPFSRVGARHGVELRHLGPGGATPVPTMSPTDSQGERVGSMGRHGKFIVTDVEGDLTWVIHLGHVRTDGARRGRRRRAAPHPFRRTDRSWRRGAPRRSSHLRLRRRPDASRTRRSRHLVDLGPDALDELPSSRAWPDAMDGRSVAIKTLLLDQRFLAGLGNIYADEVLARAGIRPDRPSGSLGLREVKSMRAAIRPVLEAGLRYGGTSLADLAYLLPDGRAGEYTRRLRVYGRAGRALPAVRRCHRAVVLGGRSTHFCPVCQR